MMITTIIGFMLEERKVERLKNPKIWDRERERQKDASWCGGSDVNFVYTNLFLFL